MAQRIDAELSSRARSMRTDAPEPERRLWSRLRSSQVGRKFRRQAVIEPYIGDFLCPWNGFIIEIDGDTHDVEYDLRRDCALENLGYTVLRFTNTEIMSNIEGAIEVIASKLILLPERRWSTHPNPSLGREGL